MHRLKNRRAAILARREAEGDTPRNVLKSNDLPTSPAFEHNGAPLPHQPIPPKPSPAASHSPTVASSGFTAVNTRHSLPSSDLNPFQTSRDLLPPHEPILNGTQTATPAHAIAHQMPEQRPPTASGDDWMNKFLTPSERAAGMTADTIRRETMSSTYRSTSRGETIPAAADDGMRSASISGRRQDTRRQSEDALPEKVVAATSTEIPGPSVPIPNTPASLMPQQKPNTWNRDDGGPYKAEMISRMETMKRGERVIPPCDRCRRLHMDCIKNLTACLGCTKKHAKCSWKDVSLEELESTAPAARERAEKEAESAAPSSSEWDSILKQTKSEVSEPMRASPASGSGPAAENVEMSSNKASTPRISSPPQNGTARPASHSHDSPRLDLRPPPLDQQLRDAADDKPQPQSPYARYSPFQRPPSQQQHLYTSSKTKEESTQDSGDRLAAIASQVYRSASQNTNRASEPKSGETPS